MLPAILAAAAGGAAAQAPAVERPAATASGKVVSPLVVSPAPKAPPIDARVDVGGDDSAAGQAVLVWPRRARVRGTPGHVVLSCHVDVHGLAERCRIASESPQGWGFGTAALQLRPTFKLKPAQGPAGPVAAEMNIAVEFKPPAAEFDMGLQTARPMGGGQDSMGTNISIRGNPLPMREVTMMNNPVWVAAPSFEDLARAYPARGAGVEGYAVVHCQVEPSGGLRRCVAARELPTRRGFGAAAVSLARKFRVASDALAKAPRGAPVEVDIPIRMPPPAALAERRVEAPLWIAGFDPEKAPGLFPPQAADQGLTSGRGVARCVVGDDGSMTGCTPEAGDPGGLGFSRAAVKLASTMKMNLWSADGAPVQGGVVRIPIRLNLEGAQ
jgi:TonB family protein